MSKEIEGVPITVVPQGKRGECVPKPVSVVDDDPNCVRIGKPVPHEWVGLSWYIATVRSGFEEQARDELETAGLSVFHLEGKVARRVGPRNGHKRMFNYPVFRGYVFVSDLARVMGHVAGARLTGVKPSNITGFIGLSGKPERVNGAVMQSLFAAHEAAVFAPKNIRDSLRARITAGSIVEISQGPFSFVQGIVQKFSTGDEVEILTEIMGRKTTVKIPVDSVDQIEA